MPTSKYYTESDELYHFGIRGMKWGIRRYQNEDGSRTEEGKIHYGYKFRRTNEDGSPKSKKQIRLEKREARKAKKEAKKAEQAEKKQKQHEAELRRVIEKGSAEEVMRYAKELTVEQKQEAARRLQADSQLLNIANQEAERNARIAAKNSKWNKAKNIAQKVGEASVMVDNTTKMYNTIAKVMNSFGDTEWPIIGEKKETLKVTRSMQLAEELKKKYGDYSYNEWVSNVDIKELDDMNTKIAKLATAERLAAGSGKKK